MAIWRNRAAERGHREGIRVYSTVNFIYSRCGIESVVLDDSLHGFYWVHEGVFGARHGTGPKTDAQRAEEARAREVIMKFLRGCLNQVKQNSEFPNVLSARSGSAWGTIFQFVRVRRGFPPLSAALRSSACVLVRSHPEVAGGMVGGISEVCDP